MDKRARLSAAIIEWCETMAAIQINDTRYNEEVAARGRCKRETLRESSRLAKRLTRAARAWEAAMSGAAVQS